MPKIIAFYLTQFFYPADLSIAQHWVVKEINWPLFFQPLFVVLITLWITVRFAIESQNKIFIFFLGWFVIGIGLHLQIIPLDLTVAERWFYFPMIGWLAMITILARDVLKRKTLTNGLVVSTLILIGVILGTRSFYRSLDWQNGLTLFTKDVASNPDAFDLQNNAGVELFRAGNILEAKKHFEKSVELMPDWWSSLNNLGAVYERLGDLKKAEGLYKRVVDQSQYYLAYENYANILLRQNRLNEARQFLESRALPLFPNNERFVILLKGSLDNAR